VDTAPTSSPLRRLRLLTTGQHWLLQVGLLTLLCTRYSAGLRPETLRGGYFLAGGAVACAASLSVLPGLLCLGMAALLRSPRLLAWISATIWTLGLLLLYVDIRIYGIFRYHFNGLVWNVLTTPGADEAVHLGTRDLLIPLAVLALVLPAQAAAFTWLWRRNRERQEAPPRYVRPRSAWALFLVPNMVVVAGVYAWADLSRDPQVMAFSRVYPLYPRLTVKRFAERHLGMRMKERPEVDLPKSGILLDYPRAPIALAPDGPRPNVLVVVIDSLRADMLEPEVMPRTWELSRSGRVFRDHLSSGNATRFGIFGMVYGLHGSYWRSVYSEHRSPVLVDALLDNDYEVRVLTSASMDFPEFRSTAWVRVEDQVEDRLPSTRPGGRDDGVAARFEEWMAGRDPAAPFFSFVLLDAPHQTYSFPDDCTPFQPYLERVSYASIDASADEETRIGLKNRYRNAVHYADRITGRILDALAAHGHAEDTLVVVTGDHGEEFFENGFWGHTSNFTRAQVHVPLVLAGPHVPPGEETRPTCHIDLPGTLLELMGAEPALRDQWTLGANLLDPPSQRSRVVSGWDTLGLHVDGALFEVPMAGYGGAGIAVYDPTWKPVMDDEAVLAREGRQLAQLALDCRRFLR